MAAVLEKGVFANYDEAAVYEESTKYAQCGSTKNFVVEFGAQEAQIAFDLDEDALANVLDAPRPGNRPVRWINIWGPNNQTKCVEQLSKKYGFSRRLCGIMVTKSKHPEHIPAHHDKQHTMFWHKSASNDDVESATKSLEQPDPEAAIPNTQYNHYTMADSMINYHAIDYGKSFICLGANWLHNKKNTSQTHTSKSTKVESRQCRLYSWLILCNDSTVISLQEDPSFIKDEVDLVETRSNLLSILRQLSSVNPDSSDPLSLQSVRQPLALLPAKDHGVEGSSNLFYYIFDDWPEVYRTVNFFRGQLKKLQNDVFNSAAQKSYEMPDIAIIPRLHMLGQEIRTMHHVYEGYKNLIQRILEPPKSIATGLNVSSTVRDPTYTGDSAVPPSTYAHVKVAKSAQARFERLSDRLQLLILSQTKEFLVEEDALMSTYFNINAQKDSKATARLSRAATLLAKLSVVFLPVSLMTSYFSVQIADLQGVYTSKQYWYSFAVIMSISVLALFFFSRMLMWMTETLDSVMKKIGVWFRGRVTARWKQRRRAKIS